MANTFNIDKVKTKSSDNKSKSLKEGEIKFL